MRPLPSFDHCRTSVADSPPQYDETPERNYARSKAFSSGAAQDLRNPLSANNLSADENTVSGVCAYTTDAVVPLASRYAQAAGVPR